MMLWRKAWYESRTRFFIGAALLSGVCLASVFFQQAIRTHIEIGGSLNPYGAYVHKVIYSSGARPLFVIITLALGLGGLLSECEHRTIAFTLALPARRWHLTGARAMVGLIEVLLLALVPALLIPAVSPLVHESYAFGQAMQFGVLWMAAYAMVFATSFLMSTLIEGPYVAFLVGWTLFIGHALAAALPPLRPYRLNIQWVTSGLGMPYFDPTTSLLIGPLPLTRLLSMAMLTGCMLATAIYITERQDF